MGLWYNSLNMEPNPENNEIFDFADAPTLKPTPGFETIKEMIAALLRVNLSFSVSTASGLYSEPNTAFFDSNRYSDPHLLDSKHREFVIQKRAEADHRTRMRDQQQLQHNLSGFLGSLSACQTILGWLNAMEEGKWDYLNSYRSFLGLHRQSSK